MSPKTNYDYTDDARKVLKQFFELDDVWRGMVLPFISEAIEKQLHDARIAYAAMLQIEGQEFSGKNSFEKQKLETWTNTAKIWTSIHLFLCQLSKN